MNRLEEHTGAVFSHPRTTFSMQQSYVSSIVLLVIGYYAISYFDSWPSTIKRFLYETTITAIPSQFVYALQYSMMQAGYLKQQDSLYKREDFGDRKQKEEALRRLFGVTAIPSVLRKARTFSGYDRLMPSSTENGPPGLGNWDNSCYQNSVLQALASLPAFQHYLQRSLQLCQKCDFHGETIEALATFLDRLIDSSCPKTTIWTPAVLKSMDSWQQQDAQEYFSRLADAVEKEALQYTKVLFKQFSPGLAPLHLDNTQARVSGVPGKWMSDSARAFVQAILSSPMDGMQAQVLECQTCGYSEGISLTQFNCLTLSLGLKGPCRLEQLLDEYTDPELIEGVECDQCTKRAREGSTSNSEDSSADAIKSPKEAKEKKVLSTKAKQLTLGRLPQDLVFHINRSIYDEYGNQRKNSSFIQFSPTLEIPRMWCAPMDADDANDLDGPRTKYELKCIITHSGRHDNGHYVAYARRDKDWYCFNDEVVTTISEDEILRRGNVFMLFYEAIDPTDLVFSDASNFKSTETTQSMSAAETVHEPSSSLDPDLNPITQSSTRSSIQHSDEHAHHEIVGRAVPATLALQAV